MKKRYHAPQLPQLELKAFYRIGDLAKLTRVSKHVLKRLLDECGVKWVRIGQWPYLPLSEIENKVPVLWKSLCASCQASGSAVILVGSSSILVEDEAISGRSEVLLVRLEVKRRRSKGRACPADP